MSEHYSEDIAIFMAGMVVDAYLEEDTFKEKHKDDNYEKIELIDIKETDTQCYFLENDKNIYFVFRGTEFNAKDFFSDIYVLKEPWEHGKIHNGFLKSMKSIWEEIKKRLSKDKKVYFSGHSLGGALATLGAAFCVFEENIVEGPVEAKLS